MSVEGAIFAPLLILGGDGRGAMRLRGDCWGLLPLPNVSAAAGATLAVLAGGGGGKRPARRLAEDSLTDTDVDAADADRSAAGGGAETEATSSGDNARRLPFIVADDGVGAADTEAEAEADAVRRCSPHCCCISSKAARCCSRRSAREKSHWLSLVLALRDATDWCSVGVGAGVAFADRFPSALPLALASTTCVPLRSSFSGEATAVTTRNGGLLRRDSDALSSVVSAIISKWRSAASCRGGDGGGGASRGLLVAEAEADGDAAEAEAVGCVDAETDFSAAAVFVCESKNTCDEEDGAKE